MTARKQTISRLRKLVQQASRENPHLTSRLERAAFLVLLRPIILLGDHRFRVGSEDGLRFYEVLDGHCQCSDYLRHGAGHPCKHRLAVSLYQELGANLGPKHSWPSDGPVVGNSDVAIIPAGANLRNEANT